jgi:hypothetical protein
MTAFTGARVVGRPIGQHAYPEPEGRPRRDVEDEGEVPDRRILLDAVEGHPGTAGEQVSHAGLIGLEPVVAFHADLGSETAVEERGRRRAAEPDHRAVLVHGRESKPAGFGLDVDHVGALEPRHVPLQHVEPLLSPQQLEVALLSPGSERVVVDDQQIALVGAVGELDHLELVDDSADGPRIVPALDDEVGASLLEGS